MNYLLRILFYLLFFILGYLFGSIPNGVLIGKIYHKDPREYGSKNTGGTNVGRTISKKAGVFTIILDMLKIIVALTICYLIIYKVDYIKELFNYSNNLVFYWYGTSNILFLLNYYICALGAFIGHSYSIFLKFNGGKVVAVYSGFMLITTYLTLPLFGAIFFLILKLKKHVSLSSIITSISFALFTWILYFIYLGTSSLTILNYLLFFNISFEFSILLPIFSTIFTILLIIRHKSNIKRLINHQESKISWMK